MSPIRNSAKALIIRDNKLLAIKKIDEEGFWYLLPGGGQEFGESLHATLRRECVEELGVEVIVGDIRFVRDYIGRNHEFADHDGDAHAVEHIFECRLAEDAEPGMGPQSDVGALDVVWLELDRLDSYRLYPLGLRSLIVRVNHGDSDTPIYLGDMN
jgi:8-oxo-dGTP pyrophosphatase MutT (NUDIX family)